MFNLDKIVARFYHQLLSLVQTKLAVSKLKAVDKSADFLAAVFTKLVFIFFLIQIIILLNVGLSIWLGRLMGSTYRGFFAVTAFYALVLLILYLKRKSMLHFPVKDYFIRRMLK